MTNFDENKSILHVGVADKFIPDFIEFNETNSQFNHRYFFFNGHSVERVKKYSFVRYTQKGKLKHILGYFRILPQLIKSDKIIMHGMFDIGLVFILLALPIKHSKIVWAIWGGDLYDLFKVKKSKRQLLVDKLKSTLVSKIGYVTTTIPGDYELLLKHVDTNAKYIENIMYPSHFYRDICCVSDCSSNKTKIVIQVGNSADPRNNHLDILKKLSNDASDGMLLSLPMSYGDLAYRDRVIEFLESESSLEYSILDSYLTHEQYNEYLSNVDVAIFYHDRQQAVGNIIALLSLGKKVYVRSDITTYKFLKDLGFYIFDALDFSNISEPLLPHMVRTNVVKSKETFNGEVLKNSWDMVYNSNA